MSWKISLPMYNVTPPVRAGYEAMLDALLGTLRARGWRDGVEVLRDPPLPAFWTRPDLLLSQTCGYPYMTQLRDHVRLLATPCYDFAGCHGSDYSSVIVVRDGAGIGGLPDARGCVAAANEAHSNSGMNVLRHACAPLARGGRFFGGVTWSGSHAASLALLRNGAADIAAVDCVTFGYLRQGSPSSLEGLSVLQYSAPSPGLPLVLGRAVPEELARHLHEALLAPDLPLAAAMRGLSIQAFSDCGEFAYRRILQLELEAREQGYPVLA